MVTIKLKKIKKFDYKEALMGLLEGSPPQGYSVGELRKAVKAIEAISKASNGVQLEDDIYEFVKKRVNETKYRLAKPEIIEFIDDINSSKK